MLEIEPFVIVVYAVEDVEYKLVSVFTLSAPIPGESAWVVTANTTPVPTVARTTNATIGHRLSRPVSPRMRTSSVQPSACPARRLYALSNRAVKLWRSRSRQVPLPVQIEQLASLVLPHETFRERPGVRLHLREQRRVGEDVVDRAGNVEWIVGVEHDPQPGTLHETLELRESAPGDRNACGDVVEELVRGRVVVVQSDGPVRDHAHVGTRGELHQLVLPSRSGDQNPATKLVLLDPARELGLQGPPAHQQHDPPVEVT